MHTGTVHVSSLGYILTSSVFVSRAHAFHFGSPPLLLGLVRRHPSGQNVGVYDHERRCASSAGDVSPLVRSLFSFTIFVHYAAAVDDVCAKQVF